MKAFKKVFALLAAGGALCLAFLPSACKSGATRGLEYDAELFGRTATLKSIGEATATDITIASSCLGRPVTKIADHAFAECDKITSVAIPDSVTTIGYAAFYRCSAMKSVNLPSGVSVVENSLFEGCAALEGVTLPDAVTAIEQYAFYGCSSLKSITIPYGVKRILRGSFLDCSSLASISVPDKLILIEARAFENTAYYNNGANWESGILYVGSHLIEARDDVVEVTIKEGTKTVAEAAFEDCVTLESVTITSGAIMLGENAFKGCAALESVTVPRSVRVIDDRAFYGCASLTTINYSGSKANWYEVSKGEGWNYGTGNYTVVCTDGTI